MKLLAIKEFIRKTDLAAIMIKLLLFFLVILSVLFVTEALYHPTPLPFFFRTLLRFLSPLLISYGLGIAIFLAYMRFKERRDLAAKIIKLFLIFWAILLLLVLLFSLFVRDVSSYPTPFLFFSEAFLWFLFILFISYGLGTAIFLVFRKLGKRTDSVAMLIRLLLISLVISLLLALLAIIFIDDIQYYNPTPLALFIAFYNVSLYAFIFLSILSSVGLFIFLVLRKIIYFIAKQSQSAKKAEKET